MLSQLLLDNATSAQDSARLEHAYRTARAEMLSDLSDPERALRFVETAVAIGDIRGAIAALERLLIIDPTLTNIKLELGLLYQRSGAPQVARGYLKEVRTAPETPPEMRARAEAALTEAEEQLAQHSLTGSLSLATRYETNANAGPEGLGIFGTIDPGDQAEDDFSFAAGLDLEHIYDFAGQRGTILETDLTLFGTQQVDVESANVGYAAFDTGPAFRIGPAGGIRLRPYLGASALSLERAYYRTSGLLGLEAGTALDARTFVSGSTEFLLHDYVDSDENPAASDRSGEEIFAEVNLTREVFPAFFVTGQLFGGFVWADEDFESYQSWGAGIAASYALENPIDRALDPLRLRASARYTRLDYDAPEPAPFPVPTQVDDLYQFRIGASLPVRPQLSATVDLDYTNDDSTVPFETFDNFRVSVGVRYDFSVLP